MKTLAQNISEGLNTDASSMLIYGDSGTGKTVLAASLSKKYKLWWFDLEQGIATITAKKHASLFNLDNIVYQPVFDTVQAPLAYKVAQDFFGGKDVTLCAEHGKTTCPTCTDTDAPFNTFNMHKMPEDTIAVWDSGSQLNVSISTMVYGTDAGAWTSAQKATFDHWARINGIWDEIGTKVQVSRLAGAKIVMIFHENESKDGSIVFPALSTRSYASTFSKYFSTVVHTNARNFKYGWDINAIDGKAVAKNRAGKTKMNTLEEGIELWT